MDGTTTAGGPGTDLTGRVLSERYELLAPIGVGGMAVVWRARDHVLARMVAVKIVATDAGDRRIQQEAQAAAALSHPNIAQVHDYGEFRTAARVFPYVVMELVEGGTLSQRLVAGPVTPRTAMQVCAEIAAALSAAHAVGLVHRDIKPANVMLGPTGAKVVDFGIAAATAPSGTGDLDAEVLGTPAYLAPERLIDDAVEPASDVYALGVVLYRLLSGHSPWTFEDTTQMLTNHIYVEPAPLPPVAGVPGHVADLCRRCLLKDPSQRPSAREVAALLSAGAEPAVAEAVGPPRRRRWVLAAASLVVVSAAGWLMLPGDTEDRADSAASSPAASPAPPPTSEATRAAKASTAARITSAVPTTASVANTVGASKKAGAVTPPAGPTAPARPTAAAPVTRTSEAPPKETVRPPVTREFSSPAGTVTATCPTPGTAEIVSSSPRKPYKVQSADPASVTFKHGKDVTTMTVTCAAGEPSVVVS